MYELFPHKNKYSKRDFVFILSLYNQILMEYLIYTGKVIKLPRKLGTLSVRKFTSDRKIVDPKSFHEGGDIYYYNKPGIDYEGVTFVWDKLSPYCLHPFKNLFKFFASRENRSKLGRHINSTGDFYKYYPKH